jgi:nucleoside-diphosphate-sugar epimerase
LASSVLFTGASSFTGLWFAEAMAERGLRVVAPLRGSAASYEGVRGLRVERLRACAEVVFDCPFATPQFLELIEAGSWDALAHHAADVDGYNKWSFDPIRAVQRNATGADVVFAKMAERGAKAVIVTGTVFEAGAGGPSDALAGNPYGLSKTLTTEALRHFAAWSNLRFGRFVVANPFGPFEERRFGWYMFKTWLSGGVPVVQTPDYVRDNVPAPVIAAAYADYVEAMINEPTTPAVRRPSGYVMSQGAFAQLMAKEVSRRLGRDLSVDLARQVEFSEPYLRINDEFCFHTADIPLFWDRYVEYYSALHKSGDLN